MLVDTNHKQSNIEESYNYLNQALCASQPETLLGSAGSIGVLSARRRFDF